MQTKNCIIDIKATVDGNGKVTAVQKGNSTSTRHCKVDVL